MMYDIFTGQTKEQVRLYGWSWPLCFEAVLNRFLSLILFIAFVTTIAAWSEIFVSLVIYLLCLVLWSLSSFFNEWIRGSVKVAILVASFLIFYRYFIITAHYVDGWMGTSYKVPCGKSPCTSIQSQDTVPYNALGFFDGTYLEPHVDALNFKCPVLDCNWAPFKIDQEIQGYFRNSAGVADLTRPCNSTNADTCDFQATTRVEDYEAAMTIGLEGGFPRGDTRDVSLCYHPETTPSCRETTPIVDSATHVCTQCSSYFASIGKLPEQYLCCGAILQECSWGCPSGLGRGALLSRLAYMEITIFTFVIFLLESVVFILYLINLYLLHDEKSENPRCCSRKKKERKKISYDAFNKRRRRPTRGGGVDRGGEN